MGKEELEGAFFKLEVAERSEHVERWKNSWKEYFHGTIFLEILRIIFLRITNAKEQETKRFVGARKLDRLLVGKEVKLHSTH